MLKMQLKLCFRSYFKGFSCLLMLFHSLSWNGFDFLRLYAIIDTGSSPVSNINPKDKEVLVVERTIQGLAEEAAQLYGEAKRQERLGRGRVTNFKSYLMTVIRRHGIEHISEEAVEECLRKMGRILGRRGAAKLKRMRAEGLLPERKKPQPSDKPRRFSELLFPIGPRTTFGPSTDTRGRRVRTRKTSSEVR